MAKSHMGLKDKCFLSEFAPYPRCELIDDMHCNDGGIGKHLLTFYFSTVESMHYWSTHEFRTLFHQSVIYAFKDQSTNDRRCYYHLIKYILFVRLLSQDFVPNEDIENAQNLINSFVTEFEDYFDLKKVTHNVHTSLHCQSK